MAAPVVIHEAVPCIDWISTARGLRGGARRAPAGWRSTRTGGPVDSVRAPAGCHATGPGWVPAPVVIQSIQDTSLYGGCARRAYALLDAQRPHRIDASGAPGRQAV